MDNVKKLIYDFLFLIKWNFMLSRCCKMEPFVMIDYYTCSACHFPCDIVLFKTNKRENKNDYRNDPRNACEPENSFNQT
jgi:hypothetical protein